jgi:hypothetical protein
MTLPIERARSLRWGWEFLWDLKTATNLVTDQRAAILTIMDHYPSTREITCWAEEVIVDPALNFHQPPECHWLQAEDLQSSQSQPQSNVPVDVDRGTLTFAQHIQALSAASTLFHRDMPSWENLTPEQRRTRMYVCRHFPETGELNRVALRGSSRQNTQTATDSVRRAKDAIERTISSGDGIPAETVIAKLESKLAAARKARL